MSVRALLLLAAVISLGCSRAPSGDEKAGARASKSVEESEGAGPSEGEGVRASAGEGEGEGERREANESPEEKGARRPVRKLSLDAEEVAAIFVKIPRLRELVEDLRLYGEPYDVNVVRRRGSEDVGNLVFSANPVLWTPAGGEPHLVITGKSKKDAFVVALLRLPSGDYELASSLIFRNDPGPFVLAYQQDARERLLWTSCWKCKGDNGAIVARDAGKRVVIIQQ